MSLWKDVKGYEGLYLISDEGEIMSLPRIISNGRGIYKTKAKILKPGLRGKNGLMYKCVVLSDGETAKSYSVHRLVAIAFLENEEGLPEVNHKDENTMNNRAENLEWCTRQYNAEYSKSKPVSQYTVYGEKIASYKSTVYASNITGIKRTSITNCLKGWSKTAGGYVWKYETEE